MLGGLGFPLECGFVDVGHQGVVHVARGGSVHADLIWPLLSHLKQLLVDAGDVDIDDVDHAIARFRDPVLSTLTPTLVSAWGRRPREDEAPPMRGCGGHLLGLMSHAHQAGHAL